MVIHFEIFVDSPPWNRYTVLLQQGRVVLVFVEDDFESIIVANKLVKFGLTDCNN